MYTFLKEVELDLDMSWSYTLLCQILWLWKWNYARPKSLVPSEFDAGICKITGWEQTTWREAQEMERPSYIV